MAQRTVKRIGRLPVVAWHVEEHTGGRDGLGRGPAKPGHAARCECYAGHNSASGRCNARNVVDPTATRAGDPCWCESCRIECHGAATMNRNARINRE